MRSAMPRAANGFTIVELLIVLVMTAILAAIAAPSFSGVLHASRSRGVLDRLAGSIYMARMHAVRTGTRVQITFDWDAERSCITRFTVHETDAEERVLGNADVARLLPTGCLSMNNAERPLVFNARGLPHGVMARSFVVQSGSMADTLVMSQLGRILREY